MERSRYHSRSVVSEQTDRQKERKKERERESRMRSRGEEGPSTVTGEFERERVEGKKLYELGEECSKDNEAEVENCVLAQWFPLFFSFLLHSSILHTIHINSSRFIFHPTA